MWFLGANPQIGVSQEATAATIASSARLCSKNVKKPHRRGRAAFARILTIKGMN